MPRSKFVVYLTGIQLKFSGSSGSLAKTLCSDFLALTLC